MKTLSQHIKANKLPLISLDEKLKVNKDFKSAGVVPNDMTELWAELKMRIKTQGPGTRLHPIDLNDIDLSEMYMLSYVFTFASRDSDDKVLMKYIDISEWDVSRVINFSGMFENCEDLVSVGDLSKWKIRTDKNVTFENMFRGCKNLQYIGNIGTWDVSRVDNIVKMFSGCNKLTDIGDLSNWKIDPDTTSRRMFLFATPEQLKRDYDWLQ